MFDKAKELLELDRTIYNLEYVWRSGNYLLQSKAEEEGVTLATKRKEMLQELSDSEREKYYSGRLVAMEIEF